jgi:hypothetical protein
MSRPEFMPPRALIGDRKERCRPVALTVLALQMAAAASWSAPSPAMG